MFSLSIQHMGQPWQVPACRGGESVGQLASEPIASLTHLEAVPLPRPEAQRPYAWVVHEEGQRQDPARVRHPAGHGQPHEVA